MQDSKAPPGYGVTVWRARWLMERLEYASWASFRKVINKATASCMRVGCDIGEHFRSFKVLVGTREEEDFKLTRFACFLVAQHADPRKPAVEEVRTYLAGLAAVMVDGQMLERLEERDTLTAGEKTMTRKRLALVKGLAAEKILYDFMGIEELAANSFRVTQTAARLKATGVQGSDVAQRVAREVGASVRAMMIENSGHAPESIPLETDIKQVPECEAVAHGDPLDAEGLAMCDRVHERLFPGLTRGEE